MDTVDVTGERLDPRSADVYRRAMEALDRAGVPFLVGGAYAFASYTGIERHTKDFDVFLLRADAERACAALERQGARIERIFPHWLAKAWYGDAYVDLIHGSGNGVARVDDGWFHHAVHGTVLGIPVRLCPAEEIVWSKSFVMERERFDGADVCHILRASGGRLDWDRLLARFGRNWRVLLFHVVLFGFVYPGERSLVPDRIVDELLRRFREEVAPAPGEERTCAGTLLSRLQYLTDLRVWGYADGREVQGTMDPADIARWTQAGEEEAAEAGA